MKNKMEKILFCLSMLVSFSIFGQGDSIKTSNFPSLELGIGSLSYYGELRGNNSNPLSYILPAYCIGLEQKILKNISVNINVIKGSLQYSQRETLKHLNFKSNIEQINLNIKHYFNNGLSSGNPSLINPYLGIGLGYFAFKTMSDLKDKNGDTYFYWSDGSIRNQKESEENETSSKLLSRDYKYETEINDTVNKYKKTGFSFPLLMGVKIKLGTRLETNLGIAYYFSQTDLIDNINSLKGKDSFFHSNISINYNFGVKNKLKKAELNGFDLSEIENQDEDHDGVKDLKDDCPHTKIGIEINAKGCPIDKDNDGVPDYLDKELNSGRKNLINSEGIALTEQAILEKYTKDTTTVYTINFERIEVKDSTYGNILEKIKLEKTSKNKSESLKEELPEELKVVDFNNDGQIKGDEIMKAINNYFDEDQSITIEKINLLIEHFFKK